MMMVMMVMLQLLLHWWPFMAGCGHSELIILSHPCNKATLTTIHRHNWDHHTASWQWVLISKAIVVWVHLLNNSWPKSTFIVSQPLLGFGRPLLILSLKLLRRDSYLTLINVECCYLLLQLRLLNTGLLIIRASKSNPTCSGSNVALTAPHFSKVLIVCAGYKRVHIPTLSWGLIKEWDAIDSVSCCNDLPL